MAPDLDIVVFGAGGHGMVVCDIIRSAGSDMHVVGFVDGDPAKQGTLVLALPVLGSLEEWGGRPVCIAMGIGDNKTRRREFVRLASLGLQAATVIHRSAVISADAVVGKGVVIMANVSVNVAAEIGDDAILNTACSVDHHCVVGAHAHVAPGATLSGNVRIGEETLVGAGAVVVPGISIGSRCTIAAGAVVITDVPDGVTVAGVPARVISSDANPRNLRV